MTLPPPPVRPASEIDRLADRYVDEATSLDPTLATFLGVPGHDHRLPDLSPDGLAATSDLRRRTLAELAALVPIDRTDRVTVAALHDDLTCAEAVRALGDDANDLDILASPWETVRMTFDLMPTATDEDWSTIAARMAALPAALDGYAASLRRAAALGHVAARRQVIEVAELAGRNVGTDGYFFTLAARGSSALEPDLRHGARLASGAYAGLQQFLRQELLPLASERDAVGRERYAVHSRRFLGSVVDPVEAYAWGQEELARVRAEMTTLAASIVPGASIPETMATLDADPARQLHGIDALQAWMQARADATIEALAGTHFDIPPQLRRLECLIAPTTTGGIYYTAPSDDFSRPGRMWWSVPAEVTSFGTWRELTTVYHEGAPGHHLQIGQAVYHRNSLNRWRRLLAGTSGHAEGWALYAERLMADLGFLDDPADRLGMLDAQSLRAARVVIDIGVHCELPAPAVVGGGAWTFDKALAYFALHSANDAATRHFEVMRYFGWPGQAPSYKLGERLWLELRADAAAAAGPEFNLAEFHRDALSLGGLGLDVLRAAVLQRI